jgi:hypothetical protein
MRANSSSRSVRFSTPQPTLAIGALALDTTTSPDPTLYVAREKANLSGNSYYGQGIFVSSNLGSTWTQLAASSLALQSIASVAVDTSHNPRYIYAASTQPARRQRQSRSVPSTIRQRFSAFPDTRR